MQYIKNKDKPIWNRQIHIMQTYLYGICVTWCKYKKRYHGLPRKKNH